MLSPVSPPNKPLEVGMALEKGTQFRTSGAAPQWEGPAAMVCCLQRASGPVALDDLPYVYIPTIRKEGRSKRRTTLPPPLINYNFCYTTTSHSPEFSERATPSCRGGWEMLLSLFWAVTCPASIPEFCTEKGENGYWRTSHRRQGNSGGLFCQIEIKLKIFMPVINIRLLKVLHQF